MLTHQDYFSRQMQPLLNELLQQFPAILVTGARQVGKSTLLQQLGENYQYITFDDPLLLEQAQTEPSLFMLNHPGKLILDEVQYVPALFSSLKLAIDKHKQLGMFLLSGSQAFELMQNVTESLAGRIAVLKLAGLSLREIQNSPFHLPFIPTLEYLQQREMDLKPTENIWEIIHRGSMPRLWQAPVNWDIFYASYVSTYIERDVRALANIANLGDFTRFMVAIAARSGELLNYSNVAQEVGVSADTIKRWVTILEASGIVYLLKPYHHNHLKRAIKTPKIYMMDTGLMAWLTKWLTPQTIQQGAKSGQFFETFVVTEIIKSFYNKGIEPPIYFYRDTNQKEIDLLIEYDRVLYPVEIKVTAKPTKQMAKSFNILRDNLPEDEIQISHGVIFNQYPNKLWLSDSLLALPISFV